MSDPSTPNFATSIAFPEAPTAQEIAEARTLATEVNAAAARMEAMLDRTIARIEAVIDPAAEAKRRTQILAELEASGQYLDLGLLAAAHA